MMKTLIRRTLPFLLGLLCGSGHTQSSTLVANHHVESKSKMPDDAGRMTAAVLTVPRETNPNPPTKPLQLVFDSFEAAGISGLRTFWDEPVVLGENGAAREVDMGAFGAALSAVWNTSERQDGTIPGALAFDAVHRSLLLRFPGAADGIAAKINNGYSIQGVTIQLGFRATELWPFGYKNPAGMSFLGRTWVDNPPRWHAVAFALRRPWTSDALKGPTFNAFIQGLGYWAKFGAQDTSKDRFPHRFGPAEISSESIQGNLDVTRVLTDSSFGSALEQRLSVLEQHGFLIRKEEVYDAKYWLGGYEWAVATGGRGILVTSPKLVVDLIPATQAERVRPSGYSLDISSYIASLYAAGDNGQPTAVLPDDRRLEKLAAQFAFKRPSWMPEWQWNNVRQLHDLANVTGTSQPFRYPSTVENYAAWMDDLLSTPPRRWDGFTAPVRTQEHLLYASSWPQPVQDHMRLFWMSWLMPDRKSQDLVHGYVGGAEAKEYYDKTRDWRGNFSLYRTYARNQGPMNFNMFSTNAVLFGGKILDSDYLMSEGRYGLETFPVRMWSWSSGSTQESIDHYYMAMSLHSQKTFADFGPSALDRLMGRMTLAKTLEELASTFHPGLRRFIAPSGRTGIAYLLGIQDGLQHIMHTLSPKGALTDIGIPKGFGDIPVIGRDVAPSEIAAQTLHGPWAPEWFKYIIDEKPIPYEVAARIDGLLKRSYIGHHYGLASVDIGTANQTVPVMAQWKKTEIPVTSMGQLGTLLMRYGVNRTELLDSLYHDTSTLNPNGVVGTQGGHTAVFQHKNKAIVLTSPFKRLQYNVGRPLPDRVTSLQTTIGLLGLTDSPTWTLFVDGSPVTQFPFAMRMNQRITLQDGPSYIGLIPIPATDLGRTEEIVLDQDGVLTALQGGGTIKEQLRINSYNYKSSVPLALTSDQEEVIDNAYGGFIVEMGDSTEYTSFAEFQVSVHRAELATSWDASARKLNLRYVNGATAIDLSYLPAYPGTWGYTPPLDELFPERRVNGGHTYPAADLERDSTLSQQGRTGRLEKNGAVLESTPGLVSYLLTEPRSATYVGYNPLPDLADFRLSIPGGKRIVANGKIGLARVLIQISTDTVEVDFAMKDEQKSEPGLASEFLLFGFATPPKVICNGVQLQSLDTRTVNGEMAYLIEAFKPRHR